MEDDRQSDIRDVLQYIQQTPGAGVSLRGKIAQCLIYWSGRGLALSTCADSKHLNRSMRYLKDLAREKNLRFPDYIPYALRTEDERKRGARVK